MASKMIHPSSQIDPAAHLFENTIVGAGTQIGPQVSTYLNVQIGADTRIFGAVKIGLGVRIGSRVTLIGPLEIEEDVVIEDGAQVGFTIAPASLLTQGSLLKGCQVGRDSEVLGRLWVGEFARIQKQARLEGDLPHHGLAAGKPAVLKDFICQCGCVFDFMRKFEGVTLCRCRACAAEHRLSQNELTRINKYLLPGHQAGERAPDWVLASL